MHNDFSFLSNLAVLQMARLERRVRPLYTEGSVVTNAVV
jgi:hypothetical protein